MKATGIWFIATFSLMMVATSVPARTATLFNATGVFKNSALLGGTVTIDTATGRMIAAHLSLTAPTSEVFANIISQGNHAPSLYEVTIRNAAATFDLNLGFTPGTLVGYSGGALCGEVPVYCTGATSIFDISLGRPATTLDSGSLIPAPEFDSGAPTAVPEPPSLALALGALLVLGAAPFRAPARGRAAAIRSPVALRLPTAMNPQNVR